jgi:hypothetical protein
LLMRPGQTTTREQGAPVVHLLAQQRGHAKAGTRRDARSAETQAVAKAIE